MGIIVGIDIGKASFDAWKTNGKSKSFENSPKGFAGLLRWAEGADLFAMEATGAFHFALADYLCEKGLRVAAANPSRASHFAKAMGSKNKTDKCDARILALYAERNEIPLYKPQRECYRQIKARFRCRERLVRRMSEIRQLQKDPSVEDFEVRQLEEEWNLLSRQKKETEASIRSIVRSDPELREAAELIRTVPAVGEVACWAALGEAGDLSRFSSAKALAAFSGVQPSVRQSGSSMPARAQMSKAGNALLRKVLYMGAIQAAKKTSPFHALYLRMLSRGKCKMAALGAVMHKILRTIYGVWKTKTPFSSQRTPLTNS